MRESEPIRAVRASDLDRGSAHCTDKRSIHACFASYMVSAGKDAVSVQVCRSGREVMPANAV